MNRQEKRKLWILILMNGLKGYPGKENKDNLNSNRARYKIVFQRTKTFAKKYGKFIVRNPRKELSL